MIVIVSKRKGFIVSMNKIFKVVWSKTKECYVVVSEVAKNNGGKKKVLASVLAGLAMVGVAGMSTPVHAAVDLGNSAVNIAPNGTYNGSNTVGSNSIVVGMQNTTDNNWGTVAIGAKNTATENSAMALGNGNKATGGAAVAMGAYNEAKGRASVAIGNVSKASGEDSIAIGNRANVDADNHDADRGSGQFSIAVGRESWAKGTDNISIGHKAQTNSSGDSIAMGRESKANQANAVAIGPQADANGWGGIAMGREAAVKANFATAIGYQSKAEGSSSVAIGKNNTTTGGAGGVAIGNTNTSTGDRAISIGESNNSQKEDTITMGYSNTASVGGAIAIGQNNEANSGGSAGNTMIAIGRDNKAKAQDTIAIGRETTAAKDLSVAIGNRTEATANAAIAIGTNGAPDASGTVYKTKASGFASIAVGMQSEATASVATAVGGKASATGASATALGHGATASEKASVAVGKNATVKKQATTSNYEFSGSNGTPSPAGYDTETITVNSGSAPAGGAVAGNYYDAGSGVAIGNGATVSDESDQAVVVGANAKTNGNAHYSVVLGSGSHADASDGFVAGHGSYVKARESIAIGSGANVSGNENIRSQAIGFGATVIGTGAYDATAIGATAQVSGVQGGVALGSGSLLSRTTNSNENAGWNSKSLNGTVIRNRAYTADLTGHNDQWDSGSINTGAVSVGNDTQKRQIINVAAGNKDTDAVNVAQLKNVGVRVGADTNTATITVGTNTSNVAADFLAYNGQLNIKGDNNRVTTVSENDANGKDANVNVKFDYDGLVKAKSGSSVTVNQKIEGGKTVFEIDAAAGGATSTESVVKKAAATNDTNIADISVADNKNTGDVGAKYEVSVSRNAVKDAAREAVTVNNGGTTKADGSYTADSNNPISVTPTKDDTNHNTSYAVTFDGNKAAKQIPLTYKANGNGAKTVTLEKGLDFTNGTNTTAEIGNDGVVKYNLNKDVDLSNTGSLKVGGTTVNNGGITIKAPTTPGTTTTDVKLTNTGLDNGGNTITNVAEGQNNTDAVNVKQLKANRTEVKAGDNVVVTTDADATDNHTIYTVNAVTPAVYTTPNGEKLTKDKDGKFHKVGEAAEYTGDIITSFENPKAAAGQTTKDGGMIVNNVGSAIKNQTGATYLDKLKAAADNNSNVKNAVVNVSDLKNTSDALIDKGLRFDANEGGEQTNKLGSKVTVQGTGALSTGKAYADEYNTANIRTNIEQGTDGNTTINVGLAKALKGINSISNGGSSITISDVPAGTTTPAVTISGGNLSMGDGTTNNKIVNLAPGTDGTDAVNLNQLKGMRTVVTSTDKSVTVTSNENSTTGQVTYDLKVATTGTVSKSTWDLKSGVASATEGTHSGDTTQTIADTKSVTMQAGKNLTVKQTNDGNGNTSVAYSLDKDLTNLDKVVVNGKDGIAGKDGVTIVGPQGATGAPGIPGTNGIDGKVGISGKDGKDAVSIAGKDGVGTIGLTGPQGPAGTNGKSVDISTENGKQTLVKPEANNGNQSQRIVYVPKDANGNPLKDADGNDIKREVATMDDGLKFAGDDGQTNANKVIAKQLNEKVDIIGGATGTLTDNNIGVNNDGGKLKVQLAKDVDLTNAGSLTIGGTKVNNDGITIKAPTPAAGITPTTTDVKLTNTGLDNGGNKITNVAEGTNNTDAVNVKQLKENRTEVKAGDNVVVTSAVDATDNHTVYTVNAVTPAVYTTPDGEKLTKDKDGKFHKVGEAAEYTGDIITSFENPKAAAGQTTKDGGMIVNNIGSAIKNQTPTMPAGQTATYLDKLKAAADAGSNVKNAAVNVSDLHNTAEALKASELHIAPTVGGKDADKGGVASGNTNPGAAAQAYKYNATTKQVELTFNDGNGKAVTGPKAVIDFSDLNTGGTTASSWNVKSSANTTDGGAVADNHNANAQNIADGKGVEFQSGKNLVVKQTNDTTNGNATVEFSLSDNITAGKDGANGKDGSVGATGKDGSSVVINGADGSIGMTGPKGQNGKDGINGRDGANISMTSAKGEQVLINRDPAHSADTDKAERIVYVPKDASGNPIQDANGKNIVREVATMDDGLKFGGDMGTVNSVKLNKQVDVKGGITDTNKLATGNNIGVTSGIDPTTNNATLNVQLAKDLTGLNSVELGGNTIKTDGDHITITSPDTTPGATPGATKTNKVANLADELHIEDKTYTIGDTSKRTNAANDEVTLTYKDGNGAEVAGKYAIIKGVANSDLSNITETGTKNITKLGSIVKAGDNVTVTSTSDTKTGQTTYTVNAVTPAVYTKADGTKVVKRPDGTFTTNVDGAPGNDVPASDVIVSFQDAAGNRTGGNSIVNNVGSAIDKPGTATGNTFLTKLDNAATNTPFAAVNVRDLKTTADALKANELHIAPTSGGTDTDKGGVVKTAGSTDMVYKYDAASKTVTLTYNDGNGKAVTGPKAVLDFTDLNIPAGGNNFGFKANATANGGTVANDATTPAAATAVENGGTVNFAAGKNLTVKQDIDTTNKTQTYTFSLDKDLTNLDKVVVNGKDGIAGKDGVTIVGPQGATGAPGIPGTNGIDGKVGISGKDGKDAVSIAGKDGVGTIGLTGPQGPAGTNGKSVDISTENGKQTLVKPEANNGNQSQRIVYVPKDANGNPLKDADGNDIKREVATMDDGLRFTGNNTSKENKQPMNSLVKVQGEGVTENAAGKLEANGQEFKSAAGNIAVEADGQNTLTVKMNKDLNLTKDGSVTMGDTVVNNDGITIKAPTTPGTTTTDVKLTNQGLDNGGNTITNVKAGENDTDAVNVKQLKDKVTTVTSSDSSIKVVDKNVAGQPGYDANKGHQYDITINNQGVVNNAQTPVVYTKEDGTKVYKQPDGTFTTNIDGSGTVVPANQVIASMNSAGNSSTDPTKLQNVGSSIADKTGTTFLDKINTAAADPNAKYGAVNVTDLKSTSDALIDKGLVFDANNGEPKTNKLGSKVTIAGTGALGTTENFADKYSTDNIRTNIKQDAAGNTTVEIGLNKNLKGLESVSVPGKDGVDGQDGVSITGKDGANGLDGKVSIGKDGKDAVSISGKDGIGHIGLTGAAGKDGTNTKADITVKEGQPGLNGTDGITRIVYKDKDGNDHEVATHDDGVKYAGDDAQGTDKTKVISKKLNETIDIVGGADKTKLTDNNIGVNNDGGKLKVQLANELAGINKISNGGSSITFNSNPGGATNTPAVQISGGNLDMGGKKITNVANGTADNDAVNVSQLKSAKTIVEAADSSVTVTKDAGAGANGEDIYKIKANPAGTVDLTNVNNRIDQLGEEIGRVGAQGAALSALKPIQYDPLEPTQIMAGYGNYRGNSAVALGVAHYKNESTLIHGGVSWAGGSSHMMANAGVTWKVGNRDSEAAVADRYRKGPISSAYAMQQEMAAMKAQNAGLKGEVSDLKAENEQMKAQIAAMMAKLGL